MSKIKICGLQTIKDVEIVNKYKPDYAGFVLAPSKRQISLEMAKKLKSHLDNSILAVGVFVNANIETILQFVDNNIINIIQLHGDEDSKYRKNLRQNTSCSIIQAVAIDNMLPETMIDDTDFLLFDTASSTHRGGTGKRFDWSLLQNIDRPFFLAGGLHEGNIAQALEMVSPFCLDVSSGTETNGSKDSEKIRRLIEIVRS